MFNIRLFLYIMKTLIIALLAFIFISCGESENSSKQEFIDIYKEILIAREKAPDREAGNLKVQEILQEHEYSEPQFREEYTKYYKENPKEFAEILDSLRRIAMEKVKTIDSLEKASEMESESDTTTNADK